MPVRQKLTDLRNVLLFSGAFKMKFAIDNISKNSGRLGHLVQVQTDKQFHTPLLLQATKSGSIPHLSREVFAYLSKDAPVLQLSLVTMEHMAESLKLFVGGGVSGYVGYPKCPTVLLVRDPCEPTPGGFNDKDVVPLFTRRGKQTISAKRYMDLVEIFKPDIYQGLCDADTCQNSTKKRVQKSVERTTQFMDYCYDRHDTSETLRKYTLFAPIVGGYSTYARSDSIKHAKAKGANIHGGYVFEGFHNYGLSATEVNADELLVVMTHCLKELEVEKPKLMPGAYTPILLLELIRLGVDIFDTSYAYCAAVNYKALQFQFNFDINLQHNSAACPFLDIIDERLKEDFAPVLANCKCLSCAKHTRAYIHHLYKTKELLGPILLMIHNLHHYMQFFETIRSCIATDSLPSLIELIKFQGKEDEADYRIQENTKVISRNGLGQGFATSK